jgi:hypothetical protein
MFPPSTTTRPVHHHQASSSHSPALLFYDLGKGTLESLDHLLVCVSATCTFHTLSTTFCPGAHVLDIRSRFYYSKLHYHFSCLTRSPLHNPPHLHRLLSLARHVIRRPRRCQLSPRTTQIFCRFRFAHIYSRNHSQLDLRRPIFFAITSRIGYCRGVNKRDISTTKFGSGSVRAEHMSPEKPAAR